MLVIGITGTLGAGKGTIVEFLVQEKHFRHYSVRAFLIEEIQKRNLEVNRDSMTSVANALREKHGPSYITDALYDRAIQSGRSCVIESIRTPGEIDSLRQKGSFYLLAVDADPKMRFERVKSRASETDMISYKTFLNNEAREMQSEDPNKQNLAACIAKADFIFTNNQHIQALHEQLAKTMERIENDKKD